MENKWTTCSHLAHSLPILLGVFDNANAVNIMEIEMTPQIYIEVGTI